MHDSHNVLLRGVSTAAGRIRALARTRRAQWIAAAVAALLALFSIAGFLVVPHSLRGILTENLATTIHRQVSVGQIRFNPYTLHLQISRIDIESHAQAKPFARIERLEVRASWMSAL